MDIPVPRGRGGRACRGGHAPDRIQLLHPRTRLVPRMRF